MVTFDLFSYFFENIYLFFFGGGGQAFNIQFSSNKEQYLITFIPEEHRYIQNFIKYHRGVETNWLLLFIFKLNLYQGVLFFFFFHICTRLLLFKLVLLFNHLILNFQSLGNILK